MRDEDGQLLDSVKFEDDEWKTTDNANGVRRRGTINAASSQTLSAVVGGYRRSDGQPASYSATGASVPDVASSASPRPPGGEAPDVSNPRSEPLGREAPDALMPTDDSPVLAGTFAAGSTDGSRVAMRGTSFAASKATRLVAEAWLATPTDRKSASVLIKRLATSHEDAETAAHEEGLGKHAFKHPYDPKTSEQAIAKFGNGRVKLCSDGSRSRREKKPPRAVKTDHQ